MNMPGLVLHEGEWVPYHAVDHVADPFQDDAPLECGIEDPEVCESCQ